MISLGPFRVKQPFLLAPMAGITNSPFRRLMRRHGSALVISELISANGIQYGNEKTKELLSFHEDERPVGIQLFGETRDALVSAAKHVESLGVDFVDLNLGCPVSKIVKKGGGSAMCRNLPLLAEVLSGMKKAISIPLTIKIRTGWDLQSINAHEVVKVAHDSGVSWVAIHGRTRSQQYTGHADWNLIAEVKAKAKLPIIGNGDILSAKQALEAYHQYGVDAVMIGRAALRNPLIFRQLEALNRSQEIEEALSESFFDLLREQKALLKESASSHVALIQSKKFLSWYASGHSSCHDFRKEIFQMKSFEEIWDKGLKFFSLKAKEGSFAAWEEGFLMGGHG
jgi:nifR3 family TIM-barrel protein